MDSAIRDPAMIGSRVFFFSAERKVSHDRESRELSETNTLTIWTNYESGRRDVVGRLPLCRHY
jgi:hypothetical protein